MNDIIKVSGQTLPIENNDTPYQISLAENNISELLSTNYTSIPISDLPSLGIIGDELTKFYNACKLPGQEGIYKVTFPNGISGSLSKFKNEDAFLGSIRGESGFAQARLTQVTINYEQLFMALALMGINSRLSAIEEGQTKIFNFLHNKEKASISSGIKQLNDIIDNYKFNFESENYIKTSLTTIESVKGNALKEIDLYRSLINGLLNTDNNPLLTSTANKKISELKQNLETLHSAYYLLIYSIFCEYIFVKNYSLGNSNNIKSKIDARETEYTRIFKQCEKWSIRYLKSSIDYKMSPVYRAFDGAYAKILKPLPFDFNKLYERDQQKYLSVNTQKHYLSQYKTMNTELFNKEISYIEKLGSQSTTIYLDNENMYLENHDTEESVC